MSRHPGVSRCGMSDTSTAVTRQRIAATYELIRPHVRHTPLMTIDGGDFSLLSRPVRLKLEFMQHGGSFKARGAFANLLTRDVPEAGVVAASGGNHGVAVSLAPHPLGLRAVTF